MPNTRKPAPVSPISGRTANAAMSAPSRALCRCGAKRRWIAAPSFSNELPTAGVEDRSSARERALRCHRRPLRPGRHFLQRLVHNFPHLFKQRYCTLVHWPHFGHIAVQSCRERGQRQNAGSNAELACPGASLGSGKSSAPLKAPHSLDAFSAQTDDLRRVGRVVVNR